MSIKVTGVDHIMITVGDIDEAKDFYDKVLKLDELTIPPEITGPRAWYSLGSSVLHVNQHESHKAGFQHFGITVESGKYESYIDAIKDTGYKSITENQLYDDGLYRIFVDDPFGNTIEISNA
ncbi:MAG: catechol 2,3-dioxygenase-like lactoylglutathione lyase family enzyme [Candidatus Endobugula sp.]|jgi:catechol 2,3-dioxygenase-like lactoylglutathione lyase family enzyme